jgi:hypothetical protein
VTVSKRLSQLKGALGRSAAKAKLQRPNTDEAFAAKNRVILAYRASRNARYDRRADGVR